MARALAIAGNSANVGSGSSCTRQFAMCTTTATISNLLRSLYPIKTWAVVADLLGLSERAAKYRMAAKRPYTIDELKALLQGDNGYEVLELLMEQSKPWWWSGVEQAMTIARARHLQELARQQVMKLDAAPLEIPTRRKAKGVVNADRKLTKARSGKEAALGLLLANRDSIAAGALAQAKGGRR